MYFCLGFFSPKPLDSYPTSFSAGIFLILPDGVNELMGYGFSQLLRLIFFTQIVTKCIVAWNVERFQLSKYITRNGK